MAEQTFSPNEAHRWFAVEMNNQAWDLLESDSRTDQNNEVLRNTAHAAWRHWWEVGTSINQQRAECLLAQVHAEFGESESAAHHARLALGDSAADSMQPFDWAFTHDAASRAFGLLGKSSLQHTHRKTAISYRNQLTDETDRELVDRWFARQEHPTSKDADVGPSDP